ncbi:phosphoglycerate dehydrogenase [Desulfolutivibrio sulfoxidireducens]|uniref:phosphoglycerate dehydrogenase n=1 Tax=Desulfolutivibrio sulfoxidireducens TaxID=2773299 RepID=UPI00159E5FB8|nr:phosphoglycerate dehydrogenase [Desulfolutivibrio sulfoxidireducens]QLA18866.1 hydroxyacid dehydrogenase [Desulfolutivibrio sulfoxidireducens]
MNTLLITTSTFGKNDPRPLTLLQRTGFSIVLNPFGRKITEDEALRLIEEHNPVGILAGVEPLTARVLRSATALKAIARAGIGMDSLDQEAARSLGISVSNTPDAPTLPVAELTIGMIISLLRMIHVTDGGMRQGRWERPMGGLLHGKTVGIVGCGRIGSRLAALLKPFGCELIGSDPFLREHVDIHVLAIEKMLPQSDIVSLHLPYSACTHHFMGEERIRTMKPGSYVINAARGGLIDEDALHAALVDGHLAGAALDSFEQEPYHGPLKDLKNTLLTAHIGSYAKESRLLMEMEAANNLIAQLKDQGVSA